MPSNDLPGLSPVAIEYLRYHDELEAAREAFADERGKLQWDIQLSKNRAEAVRKYLVDHGVAGERLKSEGFGPTKPICTEKTAACYDKNRRTQFLVTHQ